MDSLVRAICLAILSRSPVSLGVEDIAPVNPRALDAYCGISQYGEFVEPSPVSAVAERAVLIDN